MRLTEDPNSTAKDVNKVIASDPAISTRSLKVVNSTFYDLPRMIGSIDRAIALLGLNSVKNITIAVAIGARGLAKRSGSGLSDEAFLAGLIHDVGIMVEMQACRPKFTVMIKA